MSQRIAANPVFIIRHYMNTTIIDYLQHLRQCFTRQALCQQKWKNTPKAPAPSCEGGGPLRYSFSTRPQGSGGPPWQAQAFR